MLPQGYKVGSITPGLNKPSKTAAAAAKVGSAAKAVGSAAKVAGAKTAVGAKAAGSAVASGAKAAGGAAVGAAKGAAHTAAFHAKHPIAGPIKAPAVNIANQYKAPFNDPAAKSAGAPMKGNFQRSPIKAAVKTAAGVTGALAPAAALQGLAQPGKSLRNHYDNKNLAAEKKQAKKMDGLVFEKKSPPSPPGMRPRPGA